ncbi:terminase large subunit domain-containing protein [Priestia filamentosa]|uniref:terminase large subunit domain-containing protein n=1 Tax=Priestia filamentosa TaxID=1402861 RepID=UPI000A0836AE|nr:terminase family protein [Priestia filamentosa]OXS67241.1 DNA packaging protein [Priestia filamentosa]SMF53582.1 Terminase-like family protein [Priestia filamentosa]
MTIKPTTMKKLKLIEKDFIKYAKNHIKIIDNNNDTIPFVLNKEQEDFLYSMTKFNIILKGRQIGFTTFSLAYMLYSACTRPDTSYLIMTHHSNVTSSIFNKLKKMYNSLPHEKFPDYFPKIKISNRAELTLQNGSRVMVATAGGDDSISGNTFQMIHLSEMAKYPTEAQEEIIATAIPALAKNPDSRIVIESTAMGYNEYQKMFMKAHRSKDSVWKAHFYSWLASAYSNQFKHTFDEAEAWYKANNGRRMSKKDLEFDEIELHNSYKANFRQLMFRRYYIQTNSLEKFRREFPTTPDEAFLTTNTSVFDTMKIIKRIENVMPPLKGREVLTELPQSLKQYLNKQLFIYHLPKKGERCFAGVDVASGSGGDNDSSTMSIFDNEGQQLASFYSNEIPVYEFAKIVNDLGKFFNYAFICVERNYLGKPLLERLRKELGYMNLLKQRMFNEKNKNKIQLGFMTTDTTKPTLISDMKTNFELGLINIECVQTLEEMKIYEEVNGKFGNKKGKGLHDDLVISVAMASQALKENKYYVAI